MCLNRTPSSEAFTCLLNNNDQLIQISAIHAPISPNIPPDAPTVMYSGKKIALNMVPPTAGMMNRIAAAAVP